MKSTREQALNRQKKSQKRRNRIIYRQKEQKNKNTFIKSKRDIYRDEIELFFRDRSKICVK